MFDPTTPTQFKQAVRASFDATSPTYGTNGDYHWQFAERLVARAPIQPGQTVLDVATGTGPAAILASKRIGAAGSVIGLDLSLGILRLAQQHVAQAQLPAMEFVCGDAEHLPVQAGCVDGVLCSSSIVWLPDIPVALQEWHRTLRPGGWLAFSCFGGMARQTTTGLLSQLLRPYGRVLPELNESLNTLEKCERVLHTAGFTDVRVEMAQEQQFPSNAAESFVQAWSGRSRFGIELTDQQVDQLKRAYIREFAQLAPTQDIWNHDYELFAIAWKNNKTQ